MKNNDKNVQDYNQAIRDTIDSINEVLKKSGYDMGKADEYEDPSMSGQEDPSMGGDMGAESEEPEQPDSLEDQADMDMGDDAENGGDEESMEAMASGLSDEELQMMLEILMSEMQNREGASGEGEQQQAAAPAGNELAMSMKEDFKSLSKSQKQIADSIQTMAKAIEGLNGQVNKMKQGQSRAKPSVTNRQQVQVMEKSSQEPTLKLSKSETLDFLEGELRNRNNKVNSSLIADAMYIENDRDLMNFHTKLKKSGIVLPS